MLPNGKAARRLNCLVTQRSSLAAICPSGMQLQDQEVGGGNEVSENTSEWVHLSYFQAGSPRILTAQVNCNCNIQVPGPLAR